MKTVVIIGGGITGLSTAYYLQKMAKDNKLNLRFVLIEANDYLGGKICTYHDGEFIMETGADSIVTRKQNVAPLLEELNLKDEIVYNATGKSFIYVDKKLKLIPEDTIFGIPMSIESLVKSDLISAQGKVEALKDFYTKNKTFTKNDSIGSFLEYFLGKELVEKQIAPVLSGVYSGNLYGLTIASTLPYLLEYKNEYGSIIKGLGENRKKFQGTGGSKFLSFKKGVSTLIDAFESNLNDVDILKRIRAEKIAKVDNRYQVVLANGEIIEADFVVLGVLHSTAKNLLRDNDLDEDFNELQNSSLISIYMGFNIPDDVLHEDGTGFIVADNSELVCNACTWTSRKWEHTSRNKHLLVRLFYKSSSPSYEALQRLPESELLQVAVKDVETSLHLKVKPVSHVVTKWNDTMPNYHMKHHEIVQSLERKVANKYPNVFLSGCSYYGVGIPDCIANGEKTAHDIVNQLNT